MAQAGRSSDVILLKSTAAILAAAMFAGDRTMASTSLAGAAAVHRYSVILLLFVYVSAHANVIHNTGNTITYRTQNLAKIDTAVSEIC